jgi:hypothetical protein
MLYFVFNRQLVAVVVAHDLERGEFVAQVGLWLTMSRLKFMRCFLWCTEAGRVIQTPLLLPGSHQVDVDSTP